MKNSSFSFLNKTPMIRRIQIKWKKKMIAKLKGLLDSVAEGFLILDVHGVGYRVFCSNKTLSCLPRIGEAVALHIETNVREDHIHLYGFLSLEEKKAFSLLTSVPGLGFKGALALLSVISPQELGVVLVSKDAKRLTQAQGIGKKLAERIITELKGKTALLGGEALSFMAPSSEGAEQSSSVFEETLSALTHLGYMRSDTALIASKIMEEDPEIKTEALIQKTLKEIGKMKNG
ncbi:MAG: Holliday junction branch migration protein RuvA [Alphaproteobacteria bacterium]|nr:Holliday junction branch migration protein RuvA [Alphaproteobacteria bacterium]